MRILITGASSELGRSLYRRLKRDPNLAGAAFLLLQHRKPVEPQAGDQIVHGSVLELAPLPALDAVIHLAGVSHAPRVRSYHEVNVGGTARLLEALDRTTLKHFIYLSSRCQGSAGGAYSMSKTLAEQVVRKSGMPWTIVRPSEVIGEQYGRGITQFLDLARRRRLFPVLVSLSRLTVAPVSLDEVVEAVARSMFNRTCMNKIYTLAGAHDYTFADIWRLLNRSLPMRVWPLPIPLAFLRIVGIVNRFVPILPSISPDQVGRLLVHKSSDSSEAIRDLGFSPRPLEDLIRTGLRD